LFVLERVATQGESSMSSRVPAFFVQGLVAVGLFANTAISARVQAADYIVSFREGTQAGGRAAAVARHGGKIKFNYSVVNAAAVSVPDTEVLRALQQDPAVRMIIPDRQVFAFQAHGQADAKDKPRRNSEVIPEGVNRVGVPSSGSDGDGIGVAIIDTGIDFDHADLAPSAESFSVSGGSCQDDNGHGTHVAGIVAALANGTGVIGVAPKATLYCVKVLDAGGVGNDSDLIAGLDWIFENRRDVSPAIRVVNISFGRSGTLDDDVLLRDAIHQLYHAGIVVVGAAGNNPDLEVSQVVPATYPEVFAVASTTAVAGTDKCRSAGPIEGDTASFFTTDGQFNPETGIGVTISAPGEDQENLDSHCFIQSIGILSTRLGGGTARMSGTSAASPHVAGIVARLMQGGMAGVENIRAYLRATASRVGVAPLDSPASGYTFDGENEGIATIN
jgi:subtilisin family serine protease